MTNLIPFFFYLKKKKVIPTGWGDEPRLKACAPPQTPVQFPAPTSQPLTEPQHSGLCRHLRCHAHAYLKIMF